MLPSSTQPSTGSEQAVLNSLHYLNLRFVGVGFRGYIIKKIILRDQLSSHQKELASR